MASWDEFRKAAPELAEAARERFDAGRHKVLATLRRDGSPRVSAIEASFAEGQLWLGMMEGSVKAQDLRRDPRLALHGPSADPPDPEDWLGDAKLAGTAVEVTDEATREAIVKGAPGPFHLFRVELSEVTLVRVGDPPDHLVIESWSESRGVRRTERR
jgi:hypothetical protein